MTVLVTYWHFLQFWICLIGWVIIAPFITCILMLDYHHLLWKFLLAETAFKYLLVWIHQTVHFMLWNCIYFLLIFSAEAAYGSICSWLLMLDVVESLIVVSLTP